MQCRNVCLVVDLRDGKDLAKITDITAVLSAAGWSTDITLKAYSGESMKLAANAALFTEIARGIDSWLWFVQTSRQAGS